MTLAAIRPDIPANIPQLEAREISLWRGSRHVLESISLTVSPGRLLVLVGPNGAGKSSLLAVLAGILAPDHGDVRLDGISLARWSPRALARRRAMLSQKIHLPFDFRVREVVMLGRSPHERNIGGRHDRRLADAALRMAQAWHLRDRSWLQLSGGEQQRVQLARVLAQVSDNDGSPVWLLLDEPEAGLDMAHQHRILALARQRARDGMGVIAVVHDLNLAATYADDVALLAEGRLLRHGPPGDVLDPDRLTAVYGMPLARVAHGNGFFLALSPDDMPAGKQRQ